MSVLSINFPRSLRRSFSRAAKKSFPAEVFAFCLGDKGPKGALFITHLFYPEIILQPDGFGLEIPSASWLLAERFAEETNTEILTTVHSHPYPEPSTFDDAAPSETDWDYLYNDKAMGICSVSQRNGKLYSRYRFWPRLPKIKITS